MKENTEVHALEMSTLEIFRVALRASKENPEFPNLTVGFVMDHPETVMVGIMFHGLDTEAIAIRTAKVLRTELAKLPPVITTILETAAIGKYGPRIEEGKRLLAEADASVTPAVVEVLEPGTVGEMAE